MSFDEYNNSLPKPYTYRSIRYFAARDAWDAGRKDLLDSLPDNVDYGDTGE